MLYFWTLFRSFDRLLIVCSDNEQYFENSWLWKMCFQVNIRPVVQGTEGLEQKVSKKHFWLPFEYKLEEDEAGKVETAALIIWVNWKANEWFSKVNLIKSWVIIELNVNESQLSATWADFKHNQSKHKDRKCILIKLISRLLLHFDYSNFFKIAEAGQIFNFVIFTWRQLT